MMESSSAVTTISDKFHASDADVIVQSSDNVLFHLHRANLSTCTGAFPGVKFGTRGERVLLQESSEVLEILFQFVYSAKHPALSEVDFDLLLALAEAAEKYQVFSAQPVCQVRLKEHTVRPKTDKALEILVHSIKHGYDVSLIDACAFALGRSEQISVLKRLPPDYIIPWVQYHKKWRKIFDVVIKATSNLTGSYEEGGFTSVSYDNFWTCHEPSEEYHDEYVSCPHCTLIFRLWLDNLVVIKSTNKLLKRIRKPPKIQDFGIDYLEQCEPCTDHPLTCLGFKYVQSSLEDAIKNIPPFSDFLNKREE